MRLSIACALACVSCVRPVVEVASVVAPVVVQPPDEPAGGAPISGGTLRISRDRSLAAVADPDRDRVWLVDLDTARVRAEVILDPGDEPGRIAEDFGGRFHVALRRSGAIATIDGRTGELMMRRRVCAAPRGIELADDGDSLIIACAGGELITLGVFDPEPRSKLHLAPDLRDVIVDGDRIYVSRFRAAEVLTVEDGKVTAVHRPRAWDMDAFLEIPVADRASRTFEPNVAWRLVKDPSSRTLYMAHQRAATFPIDMGAEHETLRSAPYGGFFPPRMMDCPPGISHAALTPMALGRDTLVLAPSETPPPTVLDSIPLPRLAARPSGPILGRGVLPVDLAIAPSGDRVALAMAGSVTEQLVVARADQEDECLDVDFADPGVTGISYEQPIAVAWIDDRRLAVQYRHPHALVIYDVAMRDGAAFVILGPRNPRRDLGQALFHAATPAHLACASCHPEGGDDGHTWHLGALGGVRRTQTLGGGVLESAPLHWAGDLVSFEALVNEVLVQRMGGRSLSSVEVDALGRFIDAIPAPPRGVIDDPDAVERGRALFSRTGCEGCHRGPRLSDDRNHDIGTGQPLQTPTLLGLAARAPYFHDGRAPTLESRFREHHTRAHGDLEGLDEAQIGDLVSYLASL